VAQSRVSGGCGWSKFLQARQPKNYSLQERASALEIHSTHLAGRARWPIRVVHPLWGRPPLYGRLTSYYNPIFGGGYLFSCSPPACACRLPTQPKYSAPMRSTGDLSRDSILSGSTELYFLSLTVISINPTHPYTKQKVSFVRFLQSTDTDRIFMATPSLPIPRHQPVSFLNEMCNLEAMRWHINSSDRTRPSLTRFGVYGSYWMDFLLAY